MGQGDAVKVKKGRVKLPPKGSLVVVYWTDAGDHASAWQLEADIKAQDLRMVTVGLYLGTKKLDGVSNVMLAGTKSLSDEHLNSCSQIPTGIVTRIVELVEKPDGMA
jgi:hypothetical protein